MWNYATSQVLILHQFKALVDHILECQPGAKSGSGCLIAVPVLGSLETGSGPFRELPPFMSIPSLRVRLVSLIHYHFKLRFGKKTQKKDFFEKENIVETWIINEHIET